MRRCLSTDGRVAHIMYTWRGAPLSVYVLPRESSDAIASASTEMRARERSSGRADDRTYARRRAKAIRPT